MTKNRACPPRHPLRAIRQWADASIARLRIDSKRHGRAGVDDEQAQVLRALLLQALSSWSSERIVCDRLRKDPLARWFVASVRGAPAWTPDAFGHVRALLFASGIAPSFLQSLLSRDGLDRLLVDPRLRTDARLLHAWALQEGREGAGAAPGRLVSLLLMRQVPDALRDSPYLDEHARTSPIERVFQRLVPSAPGGLAVAGWPASLAGRLTSIGRRCGARLLSMEPGARLTQLVSAAAELHAAHLAVLDVGATLLPVAVIRGACEHHLRQCNDVTRIAGLPEGASVEIYSTWCLRRLRAQSPEEVDMAPGDWLDWMRDRESVRTCLADLRSVPWPSAVPADLPGRVVIDEPGDWRRLGTLLEHASGLEAADEWHLLKAWQAGRSRPRPARVARRAATARRRQPRVLFVSPSTGFSGPERLFGALVNDLLDRHVDLWGLVVRPGMTAPLLRSAYRERLIHDGIEFGHPTLASFDYCLRIFRRLRPDLIHCNGVLTWPTLAAADACRLPVIQHVRIAELAGQAEHLQRSALLIAVSRFVGGELLREGVDPERIRVCHDGVDARHFRRTASIRRAARRKLGLQPEAFVLLCIARCSRTKRIEVAIRAFADAIGRRQSARLLIVGEIEDPLYYESLKRLIARRRLESQVRFLWAVEDIRAVHAAADVLMLPSVREPLSNAVLEAMAMETPVIASASGGIPEMLDDSCGTLVDPDATEQFGRALRRVVRGDDELAGKARHARTIVKRRFDFGEHVDAIRRLYLELT